MNSSFKLFRNKNKHFHRHYTIVGYGLQAKVLEGSGMEFVEKHRKHGKGQKVTTVHDTNQICHTR
jgi:hypothetical protein